MEHLSLHKAHEEVAYGTKSDNVDCPQLDVPARDEYTTFTDPQYSKTIAAAVLAERFNEELKECVRTGRKPPFDEVMFDCRPDLITPRMTKPPVPRPLHEPLPQVESALEGETKFMETPAKCLLGKMLYGGRLVITNYQLMFIPEDSTIHKKYKISNDFYTLPHGFINNVDKLVEKRLPNTMCIKIETKDGRTLRFLFESAEKELMEKAFCRLETLAFSKEEQHIFAFSHKLSTKEGDGWAVLSDIDEYKRMGILFDATDAPFRLYGGNVEGNICSSYPQRVVVAKNATDGDIEECSKFRTRERFPALTYYHKSNGASIWRSSQPKEGLWGYVNKSDQKVLQSIVDTVPSAAKRKTHFNDEKREEAKLHIIDARAKMSAIGNKVMGSGYENISNYPSTWLHFCNIGNIHNIRESYLKLLHICNDARMLCSEKWLSYLDGTEWLQHLACILSGANTVIESIRAGKTVLVHCSDGWDRTSQLVCLAQIILDKYYRTIKGFEVLVEKDFLMFGHQFRLRLGHKTKSTLGDKEYCPVFVQFLDCVYQIGLQFPTMFEFNTKFLLDIAYHTHSMRFGTFLASSDKERRESTLRARTVSLWTYINSRKEDYKNPFYLRNDPNLNEDKFYPSPLLPCIRLWEDKHLAWSSIKFNNKSPIDWVSRAMKEAATKAKKKEEELEYYKKLAEKYELLLKENNVSCIGVDGEIVDSSYLLVNVHPEPKK